MQVYSLSQRPDLVEDFWAVEGDWPQFMTKDPVGETRYERAAEVFPDLHLVTVVDNKVVARLHAVAVEWPGAENLPDRGWDWALESAVDNPPSSRYAVSLIEARIAPQHRGKGLSQKLLIAAREVYRQLGTKHLVAPVRPNGKVDQPRVPMREYIQHVRADGLPTDPWLRVHARLNAVIVKVAPLAMTIPGTLKQWEEWTGMTLDRDGLVDVPGALAPVLVDTVQEHAVYIEPNVWVYHQL